MYNDFNSTTFLYFCITNFLWQLFNYSRHVIAFRAGLDESDVKFVTFVFILFLIVALSANKECIKS